MLASAPMVSKRRQVANKQFVRQLARCLRSGKQGSDTHIPSTCR
jgi:hypothetical protein